MRIAVKPSAQRDIVDHINFLLDEFAYDAAERFPGAVEEALQFILKNPNAGAPFETFRSWPLPGFPRIRLFYLEATVEDLLVVRVLHTARDVDSILENE